MTRPPPLSSTGNSAACEEERFYQEKHSAKFPKQAMTFCLEQAGLASRSSEMPHHIPRNP